MSDPKFKSENYTLMGGINNKVSTVINSALEFLDLRNFDFQAPGALTQRWGSTQYVGQTGAGQINSLYEFSRLEGPSYVVFSYSGSIFYGATTGQSQGMSLTVQGTTFLGVAIVGYVNVVQTFPGPQTDYGINAVGAYYLGETTAPLYGYGVGASFIPQGQGDPFLVDPQILASSNKLSYSVLDDYLFLADGNKFVKFDGITTTQIGVPPVLFATIPPVGGRNPAGSVTLASATYAQGFYYGPSFGNYYLWASYVDNRGFEGPIWPLLAIQGDVQYNASTVIAQGTTATGILQMSLSIATPLQYGISAINIYSYYEPYNPSIGQTYGQFLGSTYFQNISQRFWNLGPPALLNTVVASGSTITVVAIGASDQITLQNNLVGPLESSVPNSYLPLGFTLVGSSAPITRSYYSGSGASAVVSNFSAQASIADIMTQFYPRYTEVYQNRLMLAGFSSQPSTVWFSDIAEPEGYSPDANFEVRTNDADVVTALRSYATRLYIFKKNSFHTLSGDNPNNFFLQEISDQYGCVNHQSTAIFGEIMAFLDRKGVMTFNGSGLSVLSIKVQPYFDRMNYNAALINACMMHDKLRNQLLVSFPIDSSTVNNIILIYDYVAQAWSTYTTLNATAFAMIQGRFNTRFPLFGDLQGRINWFGGSFLADNGVSMTTYFKTRFIHDIGDSIQKQFRRLYLNSNQQGVTLNIPINFYQDYGPSIVLATTLSLGAFQQRIDFGISAKSLAFDATMVPIIQPLEIQGFTIEQRMQRRV